MVSKIQRQRLVRHALYLIEKAPQIHYAEVRPMTTHRFATWAELHSYLDHGGEITMDCSEAVTLLFRTAGLRDPNGLGFNGEGYTGTILQHLPHYQNNERAHQGALGVYGEYPGVHVVMSMDDPSFDPYVFSHGQEDGPFHIQLSTETQAHRGQSFNWCDISHL